MRTPPRIASFLVTLAAGSLTGCVLSPVGAAGRAEAANRVETEARSDADAHVDRLLLSHRGDAVLEGNELNGLRHDVAHLADGYRGRSPGGFLSLSEPELGRVAGLVGGGITEFDYQTDPTSGHVSAHGRWASKAFDLMVDDSVITVNRAYCTDTYRRRSAGSDVFVGTTGCYQTGHYGTYLVVPNSFFKRPAGEQVVFLNAFLM